MSNFHLVTMVGFPAFHIPAAAWTDAASDDHDCDESDPSLVLARQLQAEEDARSAAGKKTQRGGSRAPSAATSTEDSTWVTVGSKNKGSTPTAPASSAVVDVDEGVSLFLLAVFEAFHSLCTSSSCTLDDDGVKHCCPFKTPTVVSYCDLLLLTFFARAVLV
jgi:hypothetical protein